MRVAAFGLIFPLLLMTVGVLVGAEGLQPAAFWGAGEPLAGGVAIGELGYARWDFHGLAGVGDHLVLQVAIWAKGGPDVLPVCLRLSTPALGDWRLFRLRLRRLSPGTFGWLYFGQLCFSRRDLVLGSGLSVRLDPALPEVTMWVDRNSMAVLVPAPGTGVIAGVKEQEYAGWVPPTPAPSAPTRRPFSVSRPAATSTAPRELPETERFQEAAYIAPGVYRGEIGWPGPQADKSDWYKVNVLPGQTIRVAVTVADGRSCGLALYDAAGERVAGARAGGKLALEYSAEERGPWYIQISCPQLGTVVPYLLTVDIRT